jgi:hypothetical protein
MGHPAYFIVVLPFANHLAGGLSIRPVLAKGQGILRLSLGRIPIFSLLRACSRFLTPAFRTLTFNAWKYI